ncbi:MAG: LacI family DNA-binding transcriptional regulator [Granulosicoccaceae bacterium]
MSRVTIQALAKDLGLSKSTVSRALNNYPDISLKTKRLVSDRALKIGYHPSSQARGLRSGRTYAVGLVLDMDSGNTHRPFLSNFLDGISRYLSKHGWTLSVATAVGMPGMVDTHRKLLLDHKVDGFIIPRNHRQDGRMKLLRESKIPYVVYGRCDPSDPVPCFDILSENSMQQAVQRLADFGHRRIAYIGGHAEANYQAIRREGFIEGLEKSQLAFDPELCTHLAVTEEEGKEAATQLWLHKNPPTAIVCAMDRAALGACLAAQDMDLQLAKDVSVIGYDGIPEGQFAQPRLTSFEVDNHYAGATLAQLLVANIEDQLIEQPQELKAARLIPGESDGPANLQPHQLATRLRH